MAPARVLTDQGALSTQMDRIEAKVNNLTEKLDVVIDQGSANEEHLRDLKSEMEHYGTMMSSLTSHLKENQNRLTLLFWGIGFLLVGMLFWVMSKF